MMRLASSTPAARHRDVDAATVTAAAAVTTTTTSTGSHTTANQTTASPAYSPIHMSAVSRANSLHWANGARRHVLDAAAHELSGANNASSVPDAPAAPMIDAVSFAFSTSAAANSSTTAPATAISTLTPEDIDDEDIDDENDAADDGDGDSDGSETPLDNFADLRASGTEQSLATDFDAPSLSSSAVSSQTILEPAYIHDLPDLILHPDITLEALHTHVDDDIDMSDSDGGAPLHDIAATVAHLVGPFHIPHLHQSAPSSLSIDDDEQEEPASNPAFDSNLALPHEQGWQTYEADMDDTQAPEPWLPATVNNNLPPDNPALLEQQEQQQQQQQQQEPDPLGPLPDPSNPNPAIFGGFINLGFINFLRDWAHNGEAPRQSLRLSRSFPPDIRDIRDLAAQESTQVVYDDLRGDSCDMQGVDWKRLGLTRREARHQRLATYINYTNLGGSDRWSNNFSEAKLKSADSFFRFRRMHMRQDGRIAHFQLRNYLACPTRTQAYYLTNKGLNCLDTVSGRTETTLSTNQTAFPVTITTLDANHGALMVGTFRGEYYLKRLDSYDNKQFSNGQITNPMDGITNHMQIHLPRRSSKPVAAIASNDKGFRVMDLTTEKFTMEKMYPSAVNGSAISPDGRLRVLVSDSVNALIVDADTGQVQQELMGHRDYGFACDWADDGWTVATGFQDMGVKIWDARRWCNTNGVSMPLCTIRSEMAGVRNLRFSPVGSGPRILVAAEEADYINIINAQTFASKQTLDVFGEIGGVAFANQGQDLNVFCADPHRGGLLQLERCSAGPEPFFGQSYQRSYQRTPYNGHRWRVEVDDTLHMDEDYHRRPSRLDTMPIF